MEPIIVGKSIKSYQYFASHKHELWEIILNIEGSGYMIINGETYKYHPGTIVCIPPHIEHTKYSDTTFKDMYINIPTFCLAKYSRDSKPFLFDDDDRTIETLFRLMYKTYNKASGNQAAIISSLFDALEQFLLNMSCSVGIDQDVESIINRITELFADPELSITALLEETGYNHDYMRRKFKKITGITPNEYLNRIRIGFACKLIAERERLHYTLGEISEMSGYYDSHYFSRIFKKYTGMTPHAYANRDKSQTFSPNL